jgi:hypothetical protein
MTIGGSIALIVVGAILKFAVTWHGQYLNLQAIGVILMVAGVVGLGVAVGLLISRRRARTSATVYEQRRYTEPPR